MKYDCTNHDQIMKTREHFYRHVHIHKGHRDILLSDELKFEKWLWDNWRVRYKGWGGHMNLLFESAKHETLFRLKWS